MLQKSPAKINLFLHLTGRLENGYHTLQSVMTPIPLYDLIRVEEHSEPGIICNVQSPWKLEPLENNLITRAAHTLADLYKITPKLQITLYKYVPLSAGLGGGSGNAATILQMLNELWKLKLTEKELAEIALPLGADIPFMLHGKAGLVEGIGEIISEHHTLSEMPLLLINPNQPLSTPAIFKAFKESGQKFSAPISANTRKTTTLETLKSETQNDLEPAAKKTLPIISGILDLLASQTDCQLARMSGSGATCFGIFENQKSAKTAETKIRELHPEWWCYATTK